MPVGLTLQHDPDAIVDGGKTELRRERRRMSNSTIARELTILRAAVNWADKAERRRA